MYSVLQAFFPQIAFSDQCYFRKKSELDLCGGNESRCSSQHLSENFISFYFFMCLSLV